MVLSLLFAAAALVEIPQGFPSYIQTVEATFASAAEAERADCSIARLPDDADLAFCCRWDDTNPANFKKGEMMARAGVKGSFYFIANEAPYFYQGMAPLVAMGHSIGNHTVHHPHLTKVSPNVFFRSVVLGRLRIETALQHTVTSYVNPYGWGEWKQNPDLAKTIVASIAATGHFVTQDNPLSDWSGLSPKTLMPSWRFAADDRKPNRDLFVKGWSRFQPKAKASMEIPRLTLGTHAWCNEAGNAEQELWLREFALKPDYVQMNDWEYGAYRYQVLHGGVRKIGAKGSVATFAVTRFAPQFVGDPIALSLKFTVSPTILLADGKALARGKRGTWALPQSAGKRLQAVIALADEKGASGKFPGLKVELLPDEEKGMCCVRVTNGTEGALGNVFAAVAFPPKWTERRATVSVDRLEKGAALERTFPMGRVTRAEYAAGDALYPLSVDFEQGETAGRLWLTTSVKGE